MIEKNEKIRCNMYLDKENISIVKEFIKGTGLTFSSYLDLIIKQAATEINLYYEVLSDTDSEPTIFTEENGKLYFDIFTAHRMIGIGNEKGFLLSESQNKRIEKRKWRYEVDPKKGVRLVIGKVKKE
ncbi:MAG: hypothetical protein KAJ62_10220 [Desulfobacteraceae bacterium]|nr:hypothetical protein [Desulfobacteraceae bacterium]